MFTRFVAPLLLRAVYGTDSMKKTFLSLGLKEHERELDTATLSPAHCNLIPKGKEKKVDKVKNIMKQFFSLDVDRKGDKQLDKETLNVIHEAINMDKTDIEEWYVGFSKNCPDGKLSKKKFSAMYQRMFPRGDASEFSELLFRALDCGQKGYVDFAELMLYMHMSTKGTPQEKFNVGFSLYDFNNNQHIDFEELKKVNRAAFMMLGTNNGDFDGDMKKMWEGMKKDEDGTVSRDTFVTYLAKDKHLTDYLSSAKPEPAQLAQPDQRAPARPCAPIPTEVKQLIISLYDNLSKLIKHHL